MRPHRHRLQQLPQPALPEVPGCGGTRVARRSRGRASARRYFHVVYTLPAPIADLAYTNKAVIYDILFKASAEATLTIAADPKRLGARVGITSVLHTWGRRDDASPARAHDRAGWRLIGGRQALDRLPAGLLLAVRVLSRLFRRLVLEMLLPAHAAGKLVFFGEHARSPTPRSFAALLRR